MRALLLALLLIAPPALAQRPGSAEWAAAATPAPGPVQVFGPTSAGCIQGAVALPPDGPGYQAIRLSRNRHWGHPAMVEAVQGLARRAQVKGLALLWIGDLSQPRGGPMPWGHATHQNGLDADIWLEQSPRSPLSVAAREQVEIPSLVLPDGSDVDRRRWKPEHALLIRLAAETPGVDRVLVNPAIKRQLCRSHAGAEWLRRIRPWHGHDAHMHLRLRCPGDQPECQDLAPPPPGDGCDASLEWWFSAEARQPPRPRTTPPAPPRLPAACAAVLKAR